MPDPTPIKHDISEGRKFIVSKLLEYDAIKNYVGTHPVATTLYQVYGDRAMQGAVFPLILVMFVSSSPRSYLGRKIGNFVRYDIKLLSQGDSIAPNQPVLGLIEMAFQKHQTDVDGDIVASSRITGNIDYTHVIEGGIQEHVQGFQIEVFIYSQQVDAAPSTEIWR